MRGPVQWKTDDDLMATDSVERLVPLLSDEVVEREAGVRGWWSPMWRRQAKAASGWSSADVELVSSTVEASAPEGGSRHYTVNVEETSSEESTVVGCHCEVR